MIVSSPSRFEHQPPPLTAALVVCDASSNWATPWRRELGLHSPVIEAATIQQAWVALQTYPHGAFALAWRPQAAPSQVELLARIQTHLPHVLCVAMLDQADQAWEMLLREAGVCWIVGAPREVLHAAPLVKKHLARAPQPKLSFRERVWRHLPWDAVTADNTEHP